MTGPFQIIICDAKSCKGAKGIFDRGFKVLKFSEAKDYDKVLRHTHTHTFSSSELPQWKI